MRQEIDRYPQPIEEEVEEIDRAEEIRQNFYREMLERHLDELKENIEGDFIHHGYKLSFGLHPREIDELNIDEVNIHEVNNVNITSISKSVDTDDITAIFKVSVEIVFSAEVSIFDHDGFIREIHEDTSYPTIIGLIPNQSVNVTVIVTTILPDEETSELEIDFIEMVIQTPITVNYQDAVFTESDDSEDIYDEEDTTQLNLLSFDKEISSSIESINRDVDESEIIQSINISLSTNNKSNIPVYHRREGNSQTVEIAKLQEKNLEIRGGVPKNLFSSDIPRINALIGSLPKGERGIEFTTDILPDSVVPPVFAYWSGDREGVKTQGDIAILKVLTVKNFQNSVEISNPKIIRQLIENAITDDDLNNLCIDEFPRVYNQFTHGQTKSQRIRSLVEYVIQQNEFNKLLNAIEEINPNAYHNFITNNPQQESQIDLPSQVAEISKEAQELLMTAFESTDKFIFVVETNMYTHIMAGELNFVDRPELLTTYQYAIAQLVEKGFITKMEPTNCDRYELTSKGYEFCIEVAKFPQIDLQTPTDLNTMPVTKTSTLGNSTPAAKTTRSKKQPDAAKLRKIQENIAILRNSHSTDLEKISALKILGRAIDNEQAIQAILFLTRTIKNNDVIAEAVKSLGNIGKKNTSVLQEVIRLLRNSSNNLVIIEALTSLAKIGNTDSATIRAVLNLLTFNKNSSVVINVMKTFGSIAKGNNEVIQKILSLLPNNNDTNVKKSMIESLGEIASGNKSAINQLISILRFSPNAPILKQFAANSLGKIAVGDKDAISAMESELKFSSSKAVKDRVSVNLNKIDPGNQTAANYRAKTKKTRSNKK